MCVPQHCYDSFAKSKPKSTIDIINHDQYHNYRSSSSTIINVVNYHKLSWAARRGARTREITRLEMIEGLQVSEIKRRMQSEIVAKACLQKDDRMIHRSQRHRGHRTIHRSQRHRGHRTIHRSQRHRGHRIIHRSQRHRGHRTQWRRKDSSNLKQ